MLTQRDMRIPEETAEFAINVSNQRHWEPAMQEYVEDLLAGKEGPRGKNFNMRWIASMVADVHRILTRGGIFIYPWDKKDPTKAGKLRRVVVERRLPVWNPTHDMGSRASEGN